MTGYFESLNGRVTQVECPVCGATAGELCRSDNPGRALVTPHLERRMAYLQEMDEEASE